MNTSIISTGFPKSLAATKLFSSIYSNNGVAYREILAVHITTSKSSQVLLKNSSQYGLFKTFIS